MRAALPIFSSFRTRGFTALWLSIGFNALSNTIAFVLLSWLAFEETRSSLSVAIVMAALALPRLFIAYPVGAHSDRADRRRLVQYNNLAGAGIMLAMAPLIGQDWFGLWGLIVLAALIGSIDALQVTLANSFVFDLVGPDEAVNGTAQQQLSNRVFGVVGGIVGGWLLEKASGPGTLIAMAAAYTISAGLLLLAPSVVRGPNATPAEPLPELALMPLLKRLAGNRLLMLFVGLAVAAEVLAYSSDVLVAGFAREVFKVGEIEYGTLISVRNAGGIVALLVLCGAAQRLDTEKLTLAACVMFAVTLIWFALSANYLIALPAMLIIGVAYAAVDALLPVSVQRSVADQNRGAASGLLTCARGVGPIGQLEVGVLAGAVGVAATQALNGALFLGAAVLAGVVFARHAHRTNGRSSEGLDPDDRGDP